MRGTNSSEEITMSERLKKHGFVDKGDYWSGPCPVHRGDNTTACTIYKDTRIWRCWTRECHRNQDALWEALKINKGLIHTDEQLEKKKVDINDLPELMSKMEIKKRFCIPSPFLINRGFNRDVLNEFYVGACFNARDFLVNRTVVPMFYNGIIIGWSARAHDPNAKSKWIHSKGLPRSQYLYNMDSIQDTVILTEGPLDCLKLHEAGCTSCAAILGSSINSGQVNLLESKQVKKVVLLFDNDEAGKKATEESLKKLSKFETVVPKISGADPGDMDAQELKKELEGFLND